MNLSQIMKSAWSLFRRYNGFYTFSEALRMAWAAVRGNRASYCISTSKGHVMAFFASSDEAHSARIAKMNEMAQAHRDFRARIFGSNESWVIASDMGV